MRKLIALAIPNFAQNYKTHSDNSQSNLDFMIIEGKHCCANIFTDNIQDDVILSIKTQYIHSAIVFSMIVQMLLVDAGHS